MESNNEIPDYLKSPISFEIFLEPVTVVPSGITYEKDELLEHLQIAANNKKQPLCPMTNIPIENFVKAMGIIEAVNDYLKSNPGKKSEQHKPKENKSTNEVKPVFANKEPVNEVKKEQTNTNSNSQYVRTNDKNDPEPTVKFNVAPVIQQDYRSVKEYKAPSQSTEKSKSYVVTNQDYIDGKDEKARREDIDRRSREALYAREQNKIQIVPKKTLLSIKDKAKCDALITDIQNLIYALLFETGPKPKGSIDNLALLFFALIEQALLQPLAWQKIQVSVGPKNQQMYHMLKAAMKALNEVNPAILAEAKERHNGKYDLVKTVLGGECSRTTSGYAGFAKFCGTITNQPGELVYQIILQVDSLFNILSKTYDLNPNTDSQYEYKY